MTSTLISIDPAEFASLSDRELAWICIQPTIEKIKGKNLFVKSSTFSTLSAGQKSLFVCWILIGHINHGVIQFLEETGYLIHEVDLWKELRNGAVTFGDRQLSNLIDDMEGFHRSLRNNALSQRDTERLAKHIDDRFEKIIAHSYRLMADYIRTHRSEFVMFEQ